MSKYQDRLKKLKMYGSGNLKNLNNPIEEMDGYATAIPANSLIPDAVDSIQEFEKHQNNNQKNLINPADGSCLGLLGDSTGAFQKINVAEALGRTMDYLIRDDDSLPGLCLFSTMDIWEIENGVLPLGNAKRYLAKMEREHPHLIEIRQDPDVHPIESAMDRLVESGLEVVKGDRDFIRQLLGHRMFWRVSLGEYKQIWQATMESVTQGHKQQNATGKGKLCLLIRKRAPVYQSAAWRNCSIYQPQARSLPKWISEPFTQSKTWSVASMTENGSIEFYTMVFPSPVVAHKAMIEAARHWHDFTLKAAATHTSQANSAGQNHLTQEYTP